MARVSPGRASAAHNGAILTVVGALLLAGTGIGLAVGLGDGSGGGGRSESRLPADKQRILDRLAAEAASAPTTSIVPPGPTTPAGRNPPRVSGIVDGDGGPFPGSEFRVTDTWRGPVHGLWYLVYAGAFLAPDETPAHGGIRIFSMPLDPNSKQATVDFVGDYPSNVVSVLKITAASGSHLALVAENGEKLSFDAATGSYSTR